MKRAPFRADHVGSLLRPRRLKEARAAGMPAGELRAVEDECIREVVARQEALGLQSITDGEFRRSFYHVDFLSRLDGVDAARKAHQVRYRGRRRSIDYDVPVPVVTGKLARRSSLPLEEFGFLRSVTQRTAKICIPAPSMLHYGGGREAVDRSAYPQMEEFFADLVRIYREELAALYAAGCRYVQLDDPNLAFLCDPLQSARLRSRGEDALSLAALYADLIRRAIKDRPPDMSVCVHLCRGNFSATGAARGGYEPIAEAVFGAAGVDGFFLEYDDARSGDFAPLRFVPREATVVLGLVTTKRADLEAPDALRARIEQAARHVDISRLALSPQCGFSSTHHGTDLTEAEQDAKLALVVEVAREVWGSQS